MFCVTSVPAAFASIGGFCGSLLILYFGKLTI